MEKNGSAGSPHRRSVGVFVLALYELCLGTLLLCFGVFSSPFLAMIGLLFIGCSLGLSALKNWARIATYVLGISYIILPVIAVPFLYMSQKPGMEGVPVMAYSIISFISLMPFLIFGLWSVILLSRPKVKAQFSPPKI